MRRIATFTGVCQLLDVCSYREFRNFRRVTIYHLESHEWMYDTTTATVTRQQKNLPKEKQSKWINIVFCNDHFNVLWRKNNTPISHFEKPFIMLLRSKFFCETIDSVFFYFTPRPFVRSEDEDLSIYFWQGLTPSPQHPFRPVVRTYVRFYLFKPLSRRWLLIY